MKLVLALVAPLVVALAVASCSSDAFTTLPNPNGDARGVGPGSVTPNDAGGTTSPDASPPVEPDAAPGIDTATGLDDQSAVVDYGLVE